MRKLLLLTLALGLLALGLAACGGGDDNESANTSETTNGAAGGGGGGGSGGGGGGGGGGSTVKLSADPNGALSYDTTSLSASAGSLTIDFDNPAQLGHDVCLQSSSGQDLGCSDVVTGESTQLTADVKPGKYTYFCSV